MVKPLYLNPDSFSHYISLREASLRCPFLHILLAQFIDEFPYGWMILSDKSLHPGILVLMKGVTMSKIVGQIAATEYFANM